MKHRPRKRFGQNFLQDSQVIQRIIQALRLKPTDHVLEIGPGLGALTAPLMQALHQLTAIELDCDLQDHLHALPAAKDKLHLICADALAFDYRSLAGNDSSVPAPIRIVGNLPYNISTPLLIHLLNFLPLIQDMCFMLQKEVVERLVAPSGSKAYGRLSILLQYHCAVEHLFNVPPEAFFPKPKVNSAVIRLVPYHQNTPFEVVPVNQLQQLVAQSFAMRRKTLINNLKSIVTEAELNALDILGSQRPEQITVSQYVALARYLNKQRSSLL